MPRELGTVPWVLINHLYEQHRLGTVPEILAGNNVWIAPESRGDFQEIAEQELAKQQLLSGNRLDADFEDALRLTASPAEAYFGWVQSHEHGRYAVQLARSGREAVLALRRGDQVKFTVTEADDLVRGFLQRLPPFWFDETAKSITLPESQAPWDSGGQDSDQPPANREAMRLRDMLRLPRYGGGQLHAVRGSGRSRTRSQQPLNYLDNEGGRWMTYFLPGKPGDRHVVAFPGHPGKVHDKLTDMLAELS